MASLYDFGTFQTGKRERERESVGRNVKVPLTRSFPRGNLVFVT